MSAAHAPIFEALIAPHRSLSRRGMFVVVACLAVATAGLALRFWVWGAWPVVAFSLVEVPLLVLLLAINQRRARASELLMLDAYQFIVIRTDSAGRRQQSTLPSAWLRVDLRENRGSPSVILSSHGRACEVGSFLHEPDKLSLFDALRDALHRVHSPRFDNPQLRED